MQIYYFSGTGNSYFAAKTIADELNASIYPLEEFGKVEFDDEIGFVMPIYFGDIPKYCENIIKNADLQELAKNLNYSFCIFTCGGGVGASCASIKEIMQEKGIELKYISTITTVDNCIIIPCRNKQDLLIKEKIQINDIIQTLKNKMQNNIRKSAILKTSSKIIFKSTLIFFKINNKKIDEKLCTNCKKCVSVCPVSNIFATDKGIDFGNSCVYCYRCIHTCPTLAIKFGRVKNDAKSVYFHPDVKLSDVLKGNNK